MTVTFYCHMGIYGKAHCVETWVRTPQSCLPGQAWEKELEKGGGKS